MLQAQEFFPSFQLYGEPGRVDLPDLVHVEPLKDRSRLHDWNIKPHRHSALLQIFSFSTTDVSIQWVNRWQALSQPTILMIPPGVVHGFRFSPAIEGTVTTIPTELIQAFEEAADTFEAPILIPMKVHGHSSLINFLDQLTNEYRARRPGRSQAIRALIDLCLTWILRAADNPLEEEVSALRPSRSEKRLATFFDLVEENYCGDWGPSKYADKIGVSTAQLTRDCRSLDGRSPLEIIHDRLLKQANRKLAYTQWSIAQISDALGFSDVGYFSRFYKRKTGKTPSEYRSRIASRISTS